MASSEEGSLTAAKKKGKDAVRFRFDEKTRRQGIELTRNSSNNSLSSKMTIQPPQSRIQQESELLQPSNRLESMKRRLESVFEAEDGFRNRCESRRRRRLIVPARKIDKLIDVWTRFPNGSGLDGFRFVDGRRRLLLLLDVRSRWSTARLALDAVGVPVREGSESNAIFLDGFRARDTEVQRNLS